MPCSSQGPACSAAEGSRRGTRRAARGGGEWREPHRHQRLLRPARHQPTDPRGTRALPDDLVIVTKIGARRGEDGSWLPAFSPQALTQAVHNNLRNLWLDVLDVVNLRIMFDPHGPAEGSIEAPLIVLAELQRQGLVRHIGLSNVTPAQIAEGRQICEIVSVQNQYNLAHRADDALIDDLARQSIAYVPFFPLDGFTRCSRPPCPPSLRASVPRPCRSHSPGCFVTRLTFFLSPAPRLSLTCVRIWRRPNLRCRKRPSPGWMQSTTEGTNTRHKRNYATRHRKVPAMLNLLLSRIVVIRAAAVSASTSSVPRGRCKVTLCVP